MSLWSSLSSLGRQLSLKLAGIEKVECLAEDKIRRLERENLKLKQTIIEAKDRSISMIANKKGTMKLGGKRPDYGGKML